MGSVMPASWHALCHDTKLSTSKKNWVLQVDRGV